MGNLTISGPGYENVEPNSEYAGVNAGNLIIAPNADRTVHDFKLATGYATWVQVKGVFWYFFVYFQDY